MHQPTVVHAAAQQQISLAGLQPKDSRKAAELKSSISKLAGSNNGTDLAPEQHAKIKQLLQELEAMNPADKPVDVDLTGTNWRLVYSSSTAASSGKIGPFVGFVEQEFPAAQRGQYINWVAFGGDKDSGFFRAKLVADYSAAPNRDEKLNVEFIDTTFMLGPLKFTQKFPAGRGGWWQQTYIDNDYRILYANTGNVFVLAQ